MAVKCPQCGSAYNAEAAGACPHCGASLGAVRANPLPPVSALARASLILGVLVFVTCGLTALPAVAVGALAWFRIARARGALRGNGHAAAGVVLGLLAAVALVMPNFLPASPRAPVSRVQSDLRNIANALELYVVDHRSYPANLWQLTTPESYILSIPRDPFSLDRRRPYVYFASHRRLAPGAGEAIYTLWLLISPGPDRILDTDPANDLGADDPASGYQEIHERCAVRAYDPTNGLRSRGDIFLLGGI